ncbi:MAG: hypothetical protein WEA10_08845 [Actinomycetota bacterium]
MRRFLKVLAARLHRGEDGFALVTAMLVLSVMTMLMIVTLAAGNSAFTLSERGSRWNKTLQVAETGIDTAITTIAQDRSVSSSCPLAGSTPCQMPGGKGEYFVTWAGTKNTITITSTGYYPSATAPDFARKIQVILEPIPVFRYAIFSDDALEMKNGAVVHGDVYAENSFEMDNNTLVCGSVLVPGTSGATIGGDVVKNHASNTIGDCTDKEGDVWTGGAGGITGGDVEGDSTAGCPTSFTPNGASTTFDINGTDTGGVAKACGNITPFGTGDVEGTHFDGPASVDLPEFTWDPDNYAGQTLTCYPNSNPCTQSTTSAAAVETFAAVPRSVMPAGVYAIWEAAPSHTAEGRIDLEGLNIGGDVTIVTNAPIYLGNANAPAITTTNAAGATLVVVSLYAGSGQCSDGGGDCSIYAKNGLDVDGGDPDDPDDGVAGLFYTPGKMSFKNMGDPSSGALYAGSFDAKNGFDMAYSERIERVLGFGQALEQTLWVECPAVDPQPTTCT